MEDREREESGRNLHERSSQGDTWRKTQVNAAKKAITSTEKHKQKRARTIPITTDIRFTWASQPKRLGGPRLLLTRFNPTAVRSPGCFGELLGSCQEGTDAHQASAPTNPCGTLSDRMKPLKLRRPPILELFRGPRPSGAHSAWVCTNACTRGSRSLSVHKSLRIRWIREHPASIPNPKHPGVRKSL